MGSFSFRGPGVSLINKCVLAQVANITTGFTAYFQVIGLATLKLLYSQKETLLGAFDISWRKFHEYVWRRNWNYVIRQYCFIMAKASVIMSK